MVMPKRDWRDRFPVSRDHELVIACAVLDCPCNDGRGSCSAPSAILITSGGVCAQYIKVKQDKLKNAQMWPDSKKA